MQWQKWRKRWSPTTAGYASDPFTEQVNFLGARPREIARCNCRISRISCRARSSVRRRACEIIARGGEKNFARLVYSRSFPGKLNSVSQRLLSASWEMSCGCSECEGTVDERWRVGRYDRSESPRLTFIVRLVIPITRMILYVQSRVYTAHSRSDFSRIATVRYTYISAMRVFAWVEHSSRLLQHDPRTRAANERRNELSLIIRWKSMRRVSERNRKNIPFNVYYGARKWDITRSLNVTSLFCIDINNSAYVYEKSPISAFKIATFFPINP